jgi:iron complex outermembrane receptor protein
MHHRTVAAHTIPRRCLSVLACCGLGQPAVALAQGPAAQTALQQTVVVVGEPLIDRTFEVPASIDVVEGDTLRHQQSAVNLSETLRRVPGLVIHNRHNYAQDLQVSSRGFGARAAFGVRGVRLIQDGIPLTMPDGQGQSALFDLDGASHVEVLRGPFAALYGNSSGGVVHVFTGDAQRAPHVEAIGLAGSFDTHRVGVRFGGASERFSYAGNAVRFRTEGYRDHGAATRDTANLRLRWQTGGGGSVTLLVNSLHQPDTLDPQGLTQAQWESNGRQAGTGSIEYDTRKSIDHRQLGLVYRRPLDPRSSIEVLAYGGMREVVQYLSIPVAAQGPSSSGGLVDLDRSFGGIALKWRTQAQLADRAFNLTLGLAHDRMSEVRIGRVNNLGIAGDLRRDETDRVRNNDLYMLADWQFTERLKLAGGLRRADVRFSVADRYITAANPDDSGSAAYRRTVPVLGFTYRLAPATNLYGSVGQGLETPTFAELAYRSDGTPGLNLGLQPAVSRNAELGLRTTLAFGVQTRLALFRADTRNDIVSAGASGGRTTFGNAGRTTREGMELSAEAPLGADWSVYTSFTHTRPLYRQLVNAAGDDLSGATIPGVPRNVLFSELAWEHPASGFSAAVEWLVSGRVMADDANSAAAPGYGIANLRAGWAGQVGAWRLDSFARVDNAADKDYIGSVIVNQANRRYFEPAPGRYWTVGARAGMVF